MAFEFLKDDEENVITPTGGGSFSSTGLGSQFTSPQRAKRSQGTSTTPSDSVDTTNKATLQDTYRSGSDAKGLPDQPDRVPITTAAQLRQAQEQVSTITSAASALPLGPFGAAFTAAAGVAATQANVNELAGNLGGLPDNNLGFFETAGLRLGTIFSGSFATAAQDARFGRFDVSRTAPGTQARKTAAGLKKASGMRGFIDRLKENKIKERARIADEIAAAKAEAIASGRYGRFTSNSQADRDIRDAVDAARRGTARNRAAVRSYLASRDSGHSDRGSRTSSDAGGVDGTGDGPEGPL